MDKQYVTKEKLEELKQELADLKGPRRIKVGERLKQAKELGDLSENSEYFEARDEQVQVETRIGELEDMIKSAQIIEKSGSTTNVTIGAAIEVEKNGEKMKFTIVGSNEANPGAGFISNESPLGRAFLGKKVGDKVAISVPKGKVEYTVVSIQ